jgi:predicted nucleotidyltransferase
VYGKNNVSPQVVMHLEEFVQNFNARYHYEVWQSDIDWNSFVIAGGSVLLSLLKETSLEKESDVDLFFMKNNSKLFQQAVVRNVLFIEVFDPYHTIINCYSYLMSTILS